MSDTILDRFTIGQGKILPVDHTGPASYTTGGETVGTLNDLTGIALLGLGSIDMVLGSGNITESGNYYVQAQQAGLGVRKTFLLQWFNTGATGGAGVASVTITAPGTYVSPAVPTVTFSAAPAGGTTATGVAVMGDAGTEVVGVLVTNPGSGYLTAPTVTFSTGGATGTSNLNPSGTAGTQVASATNLSGETVRLAYIGK
jgi:hypothetical protein